MLFVETADGWFHTRGIARAVSASDGTSCLYDFRGKALGRTLEVVHPADWGELVPAAPGHWATCLGCRPNGELYVTRRLIVAWRDCGEYAAPLFTAVTE